MPCWHHRQCVTHHDLSLGTRSIRNKTAKKKMVFSLKKPLLKKTKKRGAVAAPRDAFAQAAAQVSGASTGASATTTSDTQSNPNKRARTSSYGSGDGSAAAEPSVGAGGGRHFAQSRRVPSDFPPVDVGTPERAHRRRDEYDGRHDDRRRDEWRDGRQRHDRHRSDRSEDRRRDSRRHEDRRRDPRSARERDAERYRRAGGDMPDLKLSYLNMVSQLQAHDGRESTGKWLVR